MAFSWPARPALGVVGVGLSWVQLVRSQPTVAVACEARHMPCCRLVTAVTAVPVPAQTPDHFCAPGVRLAWLGLITGGVTSTKAAEIGPPTNRPYLSTA